MYSIWFEKKSKSTKKRKLEIISYSIEWEIIFYPTAFVNLNNISWLKELEIMIIVTISLKVIKILCFIGQLVVLYQTLNIGKIYNSLFDKKSCFLSQKQYTWKHEIVLYATSTSVFKHYVQLHKI